MKQLCLLPETTNVLVSMDDMEKAKDKIMMGAERRSMVMNEKDKEMTAYHEAGHAIVGRSVPGHDPVYKVSIIPRGRALGITMFLPEEDKYSNSKQQLGKSNFDFIRWPYRRRTYLWCRGRYDGGIE